MIFLIYMDPISSTFNYSLKHKNNINTAINIITRNSIITLICNKNQLLPKFLVITFLKLSKDCLSSVCLSPYLYMHTHTNIHYTYLNINLLTDYILLFYFYLL